MVIDTDSELDAGVFTQLNKSVDNTSYNKYLVNSAKDALEDKVEATLSADKKTATVAISTNDKVSYTATATGVTATIKDGKLTITSTSELSGSVTVTVTITSAKQSVDKDVTVTFKDAKA